jgi:hypothetical protein
LILGEGEENKEKDEFKGGDAHIEEHEEFFFERIHSNKSQPSFSSLSATTSMKALCPLKYLDIAAKLEGTNASIERKTNVFAFFFSFQMVETSIPRVEEI